MQANVEHLIPVKVELKSAEKEMSGKLFIFIMLNNQLLDAGCSSHAEERSPNNSNLIDDADTSGEAMIPAPTGKKRKFKKKSIILIFLF